ncbi:MAG: SUMF1/EgtB/PvdO family nonheme iron enzyme [Opitutae bacterium]|nr:SUMF1/EgtB/PvdO family nonheme iron enzyme [Opitutae bacterium]
MKKLLFPILLTFILSGHLLAVAGPPDPVLEAAREAAAGQGSTAAAVAQAAKDVALAEGLDEKEASREAARASSRAVAEKEFETSGDATIAGTKAREAAIAAGVDVEEAEDIASEKATQAVVDKALADGQTSTQVAEKAREATQGAGLDADAAKERAADIAAAKVAEKAISEGKTATEVAAEARAAAEGAGLDAEAAKDRAAYVAAEKVAEKAIADGKTAAEAGAEALAAAKAAGVSDEVAKQKAGSRAADIAAKEALEKGFSEEEATKRAKEAAEAAGFSATDAADIARVVASIAVGNRTPDVSNVTAAQLIGTKLLRINYDLSVSDGRPCTVTIRWSTDNGKNFDLTATAVTGDVGPGVAPGKNLEATWDMGVDWDNKYTEDGRIEVIASRISDEGAHDDLVVIPAEGASWDLAKEKKELVVTLPADVLSPQEVDWITQARDHERLAWVDVRFPVGDNGEKGFFWGSEDVFIGPDGKVILRFPHTTALDAPGVNLLEIETFAYNGDTLRLSDLPPMGTPSLSLEFSIDVPEDWEAEEEPGPALGKDYVGGSGLEMIWVDPGTFTMGSPASEPDRRSEEIQHEVTLTQGYWLGENEVTQALYEEVMGVNPSQFKGPELPVENVSWDDAIAFIQKLNQRELDAGRLPEGIGYSLPTEAQWEYACRAGTTTAYSFGASITSIDQANFKGSGLNKTTNVGSYPANAWGFHDLHGNVFEWTADWHGNYPAGTVSDPAGAETGSYRVYRGGGWTTDGGNLRSAIRSRNTPVLREFNLGFRLSLQIQE